MWKRPSVWYLAKVKLINFVYNNVKVELVKNYTYLAVNIHKSDDIKYSIDDRIKKASCAMNMLQGALSTNGNININSNFNQNTKSLC